MGPENEKVIQTRLGERTVQLDKVLTFPRGIMGFEEQREFILLEIKDDSPFLVLQSMDTHRLGLLVADPYSFLEDYEVKVGEAEMRILQLEDFKDAALLVTVTIPPGQPEKTALNLTGPIMVNYTARVGLQVPQIDPKYPSQVFLHEQGS